MQTTLDISNDVMKLVKAKAKREGLGIPTVVELYQAWVDGSFSLAPRKPGPAPSPLSRDEQVRQGKEWVKNFEKLVDAFALIPVADSRTCSEIIMEDRNRLERKTN